LSPLGEFRKSHNLVRMLSPLSFYVASVCLLGFALFLWALTRLSQAMPGVLLFVGLVLVAELTTSETLEAKLAFSMASAVDFAVLLLWGPLVAVLVAMVGGFVSSVVIHVVRRQRNVSASSTPLIQTALFNGATLGIANALGGGVYLLCGGQIGEVALLSNLLPIMLAAVAAELSNEALVVGVVSIQTQKPALQIWRQGMSWAVPITILIMMVGGSGLALGYEVLGILGLAVFFLPLALTIYAFRLYVGRTKAQMAQLEETIAELRQAQEEIHRQAAHLEALNAIIAAASAAPNLTRLLEVALDHVLQALRLDRGAIWAADQLVVKGVSLDVGCSIQEMVQEAGLDLDAAFTTEDWQRPTPAGTHAALALGMGKAGIRASAIVPILSEKEDIGGLFVGAAEHHAWSVEEAALIEAVGQQLGAAADRLRLLRRVRQHAEELEVAVAQLQELDRLKNEFMQNASHELRTPLALICGYMELIRDGEFGRLPANQREALQVIMRQTEMLVVLVEDITFSLAAKAQSFEGEPVQMDDLVLAAADDFRVSVERAELVMHTEVPSHLAPVWGEPSYLRRVLDNLVSNAIKYTPEGGTLTLRLEEQGDWIVLQVADTGIGISPGEQQRIFERFYQVDGSVRRKYGGMGLGLALVKEIVEAHHGRVDVQSVVGEGSTFAVSLPAVRDPPSTDPSSGSGPSAVHDTEDHTEDQV
jgi:signal transduction histidine kinase